MTAHCTQLLQVVVAALQMAVTGRPFHQELETKHTENEFRGFHQEFHLQIQMFLFGIL